MDSDRFLVNQLLEKVAGNILIPSVVVSWVSQGEASNRLGSTLDKYNSDPQKDNNQ